MNLAVEHLCVARGARLVIDQLSFSLAAGEAMLLTGPNGAGKTTLIRAIAGFLAPISGSIRIEGGDSERDVVEHCHYVGHLNGIKGALTVEENLAFWARFLGSGDPAGEGSRIETALARFDLEALAGIPANYLSAGQKRRAGLARLLVADRPVWLLDEPSVSLDAASTDLLAAVVSEHAEAGGLVLAATHLPLGFAKTRELRLGPHAEAA